ncbi:MAG: hypothetical protein JNK85_26635 [Verrucomicrobiales bacterium]|nr:hypothetical protein [Verrucomicrobiales bacterium]
MGGSHVFCLIVVTDDEQTHLIPTAHLIGVVIDLRAPDSTPHEINRERAVLRFTEAEVTLRGRRLNRLAESLATNKVLRVRAVPPMSVNAQTKDLHITSVSVRWT